MKNFRKAAQRFIGWFENIFLWDYYYSKLRRPKTRACVALTAGDEDNIENSFKDSGYTVRDLNIDVAGYRNYLAGAGYGGYPQYCGGGKSREFSEKSLEHYVAAFLLELKPTDKYIDIANANSPAPEIYGRIYGCKAYRQDLIFPEGINGVAIGGSACSLPLENASVDKMALHCSFEHFEHDSDTKFIREAARVLKKGGKLCILPLHMNGRYMIQTDPLFSRGDNSIFEEGTLLYAALSWKNSHGRCYDVENFSKRVRGTAAGAGFGLEIHAARNARQVNQACYLKFIALFEKK